MNVPSLVVILLLILGLFRSISFLTYLVFILPVFGSLALVPPEWIGGTSLTPITIAALFFVIKAMSSSTNLKNMLLAATDIKQLGFLSSFLIIAIIGSIVLPHLFEGDIRVFAMRSTGLPEFVAPTMANFTQISYLTLSTLVAFTAAALVRDPVYVEVLLKAILVGACAVIASGLVDIITHILGVQGLLSYFRTATYSYMTENYIMDTRRIIGFMSEASAFGGLAASSFALLLFLRPVYPPQLWRWKEPAVTLGCLIMALLSTSSTAYVGVGISLLLYMFYNLRQITPDGKVLHSTLVRKFLVFGAIIMMISIFITLDSHFASYCMKMIDKLILQKQNTSSFAERSSWTAAGLNAFFESDGLGVGIGSVRTSNFFVNLLASTGVPGAFFYLLFLIVLFTRRAPNGNARTKAMVLALKLALIPGFIGSALAATTPDFGVEAGLTYGVIVGLCRSTKSSTWRSPLLKGQEQPGIT